MKKLILTFALVLPLLLSAQTGSLTVKVHGITEHKGNVIISLYDSESTFLKTPIYEKAVAASASSVVVAFDELPQGDYAIAVVHDANTNGELDTRTFGIPMEGYGFSNDAPAKFGPAKYEEALFTVDDSTEQNINLIHIRSSIF
ncbi:DUF2141 domain-containing protein [Marinoscillum furvescens]|uniref:Uncharacterized protein (DUF2141 family) n=1 Tax=Marinoscillum furvescens DSM 4134 TaxID=1122208 RepID=A0A3D9KYA3_MARFU|nr:DUF2141 domain-containing protein [Marinoscillum furvescens]RED92038.1 uncharacterized protein (DUF2141 family) [Marinoscillum furvescens DSM 4134]